MASAASTKASPPDAPSGPARLRGEDRRAALVAAAAGLVAEAGPDAVSMETVAARAEVSRPLVYKHFANRDELLAAVFRREAAELDASMAAKVRGAEGFEGKVRALLQAVLTATSSPGPIFAPLLRTGARSVEFQREQRARDRRTVRFFARLAMDELGLDEAAATAAMSVLLTGVESIRAQWRARPTAERAQFLEDIYVDLVVGGLARIAADGGCRA